MSRLENIQNTFKSAQHKTKAFLHRQQWKEALVFFFFVLLAFGFWLLQSLQQEYEIEIDIPVRYKNVPADITFTGATPEKVSAKVKDKGSVLLNYSFGRTFAPIEINMKDSENKSGTQVITQKEIENDILKQLIATSSLIEFTPATLEIAYSKRQHKSVPVAFNGTVKTTPGFQLSGEVRINPDHVDVYAGESALDTLVVIKTVPTEIKNGNKTIVRNIQLQKTEGINIDPEVVSVTIPIEEYTEKTLEIPVHCLDIPAHYTVRMFPPTIKVNCSVPLSRFKELSEDQFVIRISFAELEQNLNGTLPVYLSQQPEWVHTATLTPDKIEFVLEQKKSND